MSRRIQTELRKNLNNIKPSEMKETISALQKDNEALYKQLITSPLGNIPNRLAFEQAPKKKFILSIDIDSLKAVNDLFQDQSAGDELIQRTCRILDEECSEVYHISGDELVCQGNSIEILYKNILSASDKLKKERIIRYNKKLSTIIVQKGIRITWGMGNNKLDADVDLKTNKELREKDGLRSPRGEKPIGFFVVQCSKNLEYN